ncbi:MAG: hypothetical protein HZA08_08940 [Nitrospirae bacterium]|nr:hypothetical protein [Nitrospirota bacterium]
MNNSYHTTASGWLFDIYLDGDVIRLWFIKEDGTHLFLCDQYAPSFFVRTTPPVLNRAFQRRPLNSIPVTITPVERIELQSGKYVPVLEVKVQRPSQYNEVVSTLDKWSGGQLELFTCDISVVQRYLWDKKIFPLAFCSWEAAGDGRLLTISSLDDPWSVDYRIPPLNIMEMKVEGDLINPRHGYSGRLELLWDGEKRIIEGDSPELFLETFSRILQQCDPDVIVSYWGDSYHIPLLQRMERQYRIPLSLNREIGGVSTEYNPIPTLTLPLKGREFSRRGKSYFSYGRIVRRENAFYLAGRWHLDVKNSFIMHESGLEGIIELARISSIPVQSLARSSIGTVISAMQMHQAYKEGILIPWRKQEPEAFKTAEELITSDKGGLIFMPEPGIYGDTAELDFASLYPTIMAKYNISQETLDCECCPHHVVPETGRHTCTKREGLIPRVLKPILEKRAEYKRMMGGQGGQRSLSNEGETQRDRNVPPILNLHTDRRGFLTPPVGFTDEDRLRFKQRQTALKWILVTCFGYLGYKNARFGRIEAHEAVTAYGRELLLRAKEIAEAEGFKLIHAIVDSVWVYKKGITDQDAVMLSDKITKETGITMALEGIYRWLMFPASKIRSNLAVSNRYLGVFRNGEMKVRGIEMRRHDTPLFIAKAQKEIIAVLSQARTPEELSQYVDDALKVVEDYIYQLSDGRVSPMELSISKHLTKRPEDYDRAIDTAIVAQSLLARGIRLEPGENIRMIITSAGDKDHASRVRPLSFSFAGHEYDRGKYTELLLNAAETVLKPLGYDVFTRKSSTAG